MKNLFSTRYSAGSFNVALLLLRLTFGFGLFLNHGYGKLINFSKTASNMPPFLGLNGTTVACLVIFAEVFCAVLLILGLFTRYATIPIIICMGYAFFIAHNSEFMGKGEMSAMYLAAALAILFVGPGKISVDGMIGK